MKTMMANIGWSDKYDGGVVEGGHDYLKKTAGKGYEIWNFHAYPDGMFRGYIKVGGEDELPDLSDESRKGWTIVFYSRDPRDGKQKVVGYYQEAEVLEDWELRPERKKDANGEPYTYNVEAPVAKSRLLALGERPVMGRSFGRATLVYLTDRNSGDVREKYRDVYNFVARLLKTHPPSFKPSGSIGTTSGMPIEFDAIVFQEGKDFIAHCLELDISSCGHDVDEARQNLKTAVRLFVDEAKKLGTLEDILSEAGYQRSPNGTWRSPRIVATEVMSLAAKA